MEVMGEQDVTDWMAALGWMVAMSWLNVEFHSNWISRLPNP